MSGEHRSYEKSGEFLRYISIIFVHIHISKHIEVINVSRKQYVMIQLHLKVEYKIKIESRMRIVEL